MNHHPYILLLLLFVSSAAIAQKRPAAIGLYGNIHLGFTYPINGGEVIRHNSLTGGWDFGLRFRNVFVDFERLGQSDMHGEKFTYQTEDGQTMGEQSVADLRSVRLGYYFNPDTLGATGLFIGIGKATFIYKPEMPQGFDEDKSMQTELKGSSRTLSLGLMLIVNNFLPSRSAIGPILGLNFRIIQVLSTEYDYPGNVHFPSRTFQMDLFFGFGLKSNR